MGKYCFGVDVGGTTVKLGLFNTSGDLMEKWEIPTVTEDDGKAILPDCAKSILKKMDERKMSASASVHRDRLTLRAHFMVQSILAGEP